MSGDVTPKRSCRRGRHNWRFDGYRVPVSLPGYSGDMYLAICQDCDAIKCKSVTMLSTGGTDL